METFWKAFAIVMGILVALWVAIVFPSWIVSFFVSWGTKIAKDDPAPRKRRGPTIEAEVVD